MLSGRRTGGARPLRHGLYVVLAAGIAAGLLAGCGPSQSNLGSKKSDWAKSKPPPQWRGPGEPAAPPRSEVTGPGGPPGTAAPATGAPAPGPNGAGGR